MNFNLNIIDILRAPLDVTNALIHSESPNLSHNNTTLPNAATITPPVPLQAGNTYDLVFPAGASIAGGSTTLTSSPADLNIPLSAAFLAAGGTIPITPSVNIDDLDFAALSVVPVVGAPQAITSMLNTIGLVVVTTPAPHGLVVGNEFSITGATPAMEDGTHKVLAVGGPNTFTFTATTSSDTDASTGGTFSFHDLTSAYNENIEIRGEDITITIDWGAGSQVFTGTNTVSGLVIPDGSSVDITVASSGYWDYTNTVQVYTNEVTGSVLLQPIITDPMDAAYRRPYPNFFTIIEPCTYTIHVYDGQAAPFGVISYEESGTNFSTGSRNTTLDTCIPDIASITQRIVVREIPNCGGASPVLWDETYTIDGIQTTEYKPVFQLDNEFNCCVAINEEITLIPELLDMNSVAPHDVCDVDSDPGVSLNYSLLTPALAIVDLGSYTAAEISTGPLAALEGVFTPDELGTYVLTVTLTNCCTTITQTYDINICDSWQITNTDCNKVVITNLGGQHTLTYTAKELTENNIFEIMTIGAVLQEDIAIAPGESVELDMVADNLYTFDLITDAPGDEAQEKIFLLDCNIKKCKKEFLLAVTCPPATCDEAARRELYKDYVHFKTLEEILYYRWDEWVRQQTVYPSFSINDIMENVLSIKDVMTDIAKLCSTCGVTEDDCGCS